MFLFGGFGHIRGDGSDQSVAEQNAEKSANQRGGNLLSDFLRWAAQGLHGNDDAQHRGDDARPGQRICHRAKRSCWLSRIVVVDLHVEIEHLV